MIDDIDDLTEYALGELDKHGLKSTETVTDPVTGRQIPNVLTGHQFMMKLHHMAGHKEQGRGLGGYTAEGVPARYGSDSSKRFALMNTSAMLSHGGIELLKDSIHTRGGRNDEYWQTLMSGHRPPPPRVPHVYQKFVHMLQGAGVNVVRTGSQTHVMALTDRDVDQMAGDRELQNAETVDWQGGLKPVSGGLFDPTLTGGHGSGRWAKITLHEPLPNPAFEEPIRRVLGLTQKGLLDVLAGRAELQGGTGPSAVRDALAAVHLPRAIEQARAEIQGSKKGARDAAIRRLGYLKTCERLDIHPKEWMMSAVPVLPPAFRPVSIMQGTGGQLVSDPNYLYKELFDANQALKKLSGRVADVGEERLNLYNAFKAVVGLGDPTHPKNQERGVKGLLAAVFGDSPKHGYVQSKLLSSSVNTVGRGVVTPDPDLDLDQVALPENAAWSAYKPYVIRRMVRNGVPPLEAVRAADERLPRAREALQAEMAARPVMLDRAPVLHRYGVMAFWPKLTKGNTLRTNPFINKGLALDHDGNCISYGSKVLLRIDLQRVRRALEDADFALWAAFCAQAGEGEERQVEIGSLPRTGTPRLAARGSEIYDVPSGVSVLSYDHENARVCFADVTGYTVDRAHPCVRVTTRDGRSVTVSDNESLAVYDPAADRLVKVRPADAVGRPVPCVHHPGGSATEGTAAVHWDVFASVEPADTQDVFDLIVPETQVFAADGGLIVYDTMNFHVPAGERAVEEAITKLLPSRNLFSVSSFKANTYLPNQEYIGGLWQLSQPAAEGKRPRVFATRADALAAYRNGEVGMNDPIEIMQRPSERGGS